MQAKFYFQLFNPTNSAYGVFILLFFVLKSGRTLKENLNIFLCLHFKFKENNYFTLKINEVKQLLLHEVVKILI
jgi:hypothetical protein